MRIIIEPYAIPERGTFQIQETITLRVSAEEARRQVEQWLLHEVNLQMGSAEPALVIGEQSFWRVPVYWSVPHVGRVGLVGTVEVDTLTGTMIITSQLKTELMQNAERLTAGLPPFQLRHAPSAFVIGGIFPMYQPTPPTDNPRNLLSDVTHRDRRHPWRHCQQDAGDPRSTCVT
jgi:hypothetical protein